MNFAFPADQGKKKRGVYWGVCIVLGLIGWIMFMAAAESGGDPGRYNHSMDRYECDDGEYIYDSSDIENDGYEDCFDGSDEAEEDDDFAEICGSLTCCFSLIFAISALTTKNDNRRVVVIQQQPQYVPVMQQPVIQRPVVQQPVMQRPVMQRPVMQRPVVQQPAITPSRTPRHPPPSSKARVGELTRKAKNLELARNWEEAAVAYEKAGMYAEAGRIRQENLEQTQPVVQIGQVGNTVLNDSVMITDNAQKKCPHCGNDTEDGWNICPHCSKAL